MGDDREPKTRYTSEIQAMMYTFGDVKTPLPGSAQLIEQIVKKQLVDIMVQAAHVAHDIRNARSLISEDIIFVIRKDAVKVLRLKEFLSWRDLRKNAKTGDDTNGVNTLDAGDEDLIGFGQIEELGTEAGGTNRPIKIIKKRQAKLSWDLFSGILAETTNGELDHLEDEEDDPDALADSMRRLRQADEMTREMSREEYIEYSECRQASFTYKKAKKFRDWLNPAQYIDFRLNDDVIEILGFLAWDMVRSLTETALMIKGQARIVPNEDANEDKCDLFSSPSEKTAITPDHLHAAILHFDRNLLNPARFLNPSHLYRRSFRLF